jgi:hypothetical protein
MFATDKRPLISKSVVVTRIEIHPTGEEPDRHVVRAARGVSHTTTTCGVPTKSNLGLCSWDEVLAPCNTRSGYHSGLPHSPSNKPPRSRVRWFGKVVTGLLGLLALIKPGMRSVQIKACHWGQNDMVLNRHKQGRPPRNLGIATAPSSSIPSECSTISKLPCPVPAT